VLGLVIGRVVLRVPAAPLADEHVAERADDH